MEELSDIKGELYEYYQRYNYATSRELGSGNFIRRVVARHSLMSVDDSVGNSGVMDKILDAGCGDGTYAIMLAKKGFDVTGIDLSRKLIDIACGKTKSSELRIDFSQADIDSLPLKDNIFDKIICITTLEHMPDQINSLLEFKRVLKSSGKIIVTVPNKLNPYFMFQDFIYRILGEEIEPVHYSYTRKELKKIVSQTGFKVEECRYEDYFVNILLTASVTK